MFAEEFRYHKIDLINRTASLNEHTLSATDYIYLFKRQCASVLLLSFRADLFKNSYHTALRTIHPFILKIDLLNSGV